MAEVIFRSGFIALEVISWNNKTANCMKISGKMQCG